MNYKQWLQGLATQALAARQVFSWTQASIQELSYMQECHRTSVSKIEAYPLQAVCNGNTSGLKP